MYVRVNSNKIVEMLPMFFAILIGIAVCVWVIFLLLKKKDESKQLITRTVKVLEKPVQQGMVEWYLVECENGERLKLRSFKANSLIITVGDKGIMGYRGQTIESFKRLQSDAEGVNAKK